MRTDLDARWQVSGPARVGPFSAVAWHAGRSLRETHPEIPVGLINASWGGTAIESWLSAEGLQLFPEPCLARQQLADLDALRLRNPMAYQAAISCVWNEFEQLFLRWRQVMLDADGGEAQGFYQADYELDGWPDYPMPSYWPNAVIGNHDGVAWFACDVEVPADCAGRDAVLHLGPVDNGDTTWWNGQFVGSIDMRAGVDHWNMQRDTRCRARSSGLAAIGWWSGCSITVAAADSVADRKACAWTLARNRCRCPPLGCAGSVPRSWASGRHFRPF